MHHLLPPWGLPVHSSRPLTYRAPYRQEFPDSQVNPDAFCQVVARPSCRLILETWTALWQSGVAEASSPTRPHRKFLMKLDRIYTRSGDDGRTSLGDGARLPKFHTRVAAYGSVDEANSVLGVALLY